MTERLKALAGPILIALAGFLVTWGAVTARLTGLERDVDKKADASVVEVQNTAVLRELSDIKQMVRDLQRTR